MSHQDIRRHVWDQLRQKDLRAFESLLSQEVIIQAARIAALPLGNGPLHLINLVWLSVAAAIHSLESFKEVLDRTLKLVEDGPYYHGSAAGRARDAAGTIGPRRRHDPRPHDPVTVTEEAFTQARRRLPQGFWVALIILLTERFQDRHGDRARFQGFRLLCLDGSCLNLENWKPLRDHFGTVSNGKGRRRPQARMVMLQLPLVRVPWRYELGPITEGERTVAARLLGHLRPNDLVLMDRGFFSYGLFWQVVRAEADFAVRVMAGVQFITARTLSDGTRLIDWTPSDRQWTKAGLPGTIQLRVIDYQIKGFRPSSIVTSVLDPNRIDRQAWVGMALIDDTGRVSRGAGLYHRRWEIEKDQTDSTSSDRCCDACDTGYHRCRRAA